jgi:serine/threonine protein kinase
MSTSRTSARQGHRAQPSQPDELGHYRLIERLDQEELAVVYRAAHQTLDRPVQVAVLRRHDWISSSRFQLAARLPARLSHPNLVPVIDAGHDATYGDYLVTPQIDARPLSAILAEGPVDPVLALRIATQIGAALDYLHNEQIVHRDVQPANILVGSQGFAYLANLSLAASPDTPDLGQIDEADYLTPYSAPEQRIASNESSPALDMYGLGAVVYHMLSGEIPSINRNEQISVARHDPSLALADRVVLRMIAEQPDARYATSGAAIAALRQALRGHIDQSTDDMEESRWETSAEWLENPLETALGDRLDETFSDFLARARKRADDLHRRDVIRRLLNRWSRAGFFRRRGLGQLVEPDQIVSYTIYFYALRTSYETRTEPKTHTRPQQPDERNLLYLPVDVWSVPVEEAVPFQSVEPKELLLPQSMRVLTCPECSGAMMTVCRECKGKGTIEKVRRVSNPDNSSSEESLVGDCPTCRGYGKQRCQRCAGSGNLVEEQRFTWSRRARLWENSDDIEDLPQLAIKRRLEQVYSAPINPYDGRWHNVSPLAEVLRNAIEQAGADTRLLAAELTIKAAPITEMDFHLVEKPQRLYFVGFDNELIGDWSLLNPERIALAALAGVLALIALTAVLLFFFG